MNRGLMRASKPVLPNPQTGTQRLRAPTNANNLTVQSPLSGTPVVSVDGYGNLFFSDIGGSGASNGNIGTNVNQIHFAAGIYLDQNNTWQRFDNSRGGVLFQLESWPPGQNTAFTIYTTQAGPSPVANFVNHFVLNADSGWLILGNSLNTAAASATFHVQLNDAGTNAVTTVQVIEHTSTGAIAAGFGSAVLFTLQSDTTQNRNAAKIVVATVVATDASRTYRLAGFASDSAGDREGWRVEANGTVALISFFGGAAVVQQANASQAAINAISDANAKAVAQSFYNLLHGYNLAPATA